MKLITDFNKLDDFDYLMLLEKEIFEALNIENKHLQLIELNNIQSIITSHLYYNYQQVELQKLAYEVGFIINDFALNLESQLFNQYNGIFTNSITEDLQETLNGLQSKQDKEKIKLRIKLIEKLTQKINEIKNDIINPTTDLKLTEIAGKYIFNGNINTLCYMLYEVNEFKIFEVKKTFINAICEHYLVKRNDIPTALSKNSVRTYYNNINKDPKLYKSNLTKEKRLYTDLKNSIETISKQYLEK